ncbi:MAG: hypothetical protein JNM24_05835 [Bdellovibrionaceae bacterium]|nr:hypothetical protein [Pseudobdellovibrionaceae bacterium]
MKTKLIILITVALSLVNAAEMSPSDIEVFFDPVTGQYVNLSGETARLIYERLSYKEVHMGGLVYKANSLTVGEMKIVCSYAPSTYEYRCGFKDGY